MSHVSAERLAVYMDGDLPPAEAREIEDHLAQCAECRAEVTEVGRVLRGEERVRARRTLLPVLGLAAAAVMVLLVPTVLNRNPTPNETLRGVTTTPDLEALPAIQVLDPVLLQGDSGAYALQLKWQALSEQVEYRVTLTDQVGETIWSSTTGDTEATVGSDVSLDPGHLYFWYVDAVLPDGQMATTGIQRIRVPDR